MKATLTEVMKALPDFDELDKLTSEIAELMYLKLLAERDIKIGEADVFKRCQSDSSLYQNGKPAPVSYIDNAFKFTGISGELIPLRASLADLTSRLEKAKLKMEVYKNMMDIWRTLSANERSSSI